MPYIKAPEVQPKRKYVKSPEVQKVDLFQVRVNGLKKMLLARAKVAKKVAKAQAMLDKEERKITRAKKALIRGI